jgi:hypothetical protein
MNRGSLLAHTLVLTSKVLRKLFGWMRLGTPPKITLPNGDATHLQHTTPFARLKLSYTDMSAEQPKLQSPETQTPAPVVVHLVITHP